jgi:phospholipase C
MSLKSRTTVLLQGARFALASLAMLQFSVLGPLTSPVQAQEMPTARTPIKHVIIIVGENRSFDHLFATYTPVKGEKVENLLSKHIITERVEPVIECAHFTLR